MSHLKGQSAIEYLTTYGWMLLVIAIVGGSIFTVIQDSSQIQSTSGLANADVQISDFGVTDSGLQMKMRGAAANQVEDVNVTLYEENGDGVAYANTTPTISVGGTETIKFPDVSRSENSNQLRVEISYDSGGLEGLTIEGTITGNLDATGTGSAPAAPTGLTVS